MRRLCPLYMCWLFCALTKALDATAGPSTSGARIFSADCCARYSISQQAPAHRDRQPYLTDVRLGPEQPSVIPLTNHVRRNFIAANYAGAAGPVDTDDGSSYLHTEGSPRLPSLM